MKAKELISKTPATVGQVLDFLWRFKSYAVAESLACAIYPGCFKGSESVQEWNRRRWATIDKATNKLMVLVEAGVLKDSKRTVDGRSQTAFAFAKDVADQSMCKIVVAELNEPTDSRIEAVKEKQQAPG